MKFFSNKLYQEITGAELAPVLNAITLAKEMGVWVEITNLIIPTINDDPVMIRRLCRWLYKNTGRETPLHFSRFAPRYKLKNLPPTPVETLFQARDIAMEVGLDYVYVGNIYSPLGENTHCPNCKKMLIKRIGFQVLEKHINRSRCKFCRTLIPGVFP